MKRSAKAFLEGMRQGRENQEMLKNADPNEITRPSQCRGAWSIYAEQGLRDAAMQPGLSPERKAELEAAVEKLPARNRKR